MNGRGPQPLQSSIQSYTLAFHPQPADPMNRDGALKKPLRVMGP